MSARPPSTPRAVLFAVLSVDTGPGWNVRFLQALQAHGLGLLPFTEARQRDRDELPDELVEAPPPERVEAMELTYAHPSLIVPAQVVRRPFRPWWERL